MPFGIPADGLAMSFGRSVTCCVRRAMLMTHRNDSRKPCPMLLRIVRMVLFVVMTFFTIGLVVALGRPETGPIEKAVLAVVVLGVIVASAPVRRIGSVQSRH